MWQAYLSAWAVGILGLLAACKPSVPTYHEHVAPLLETHCQRCHQRGAVAPLLTFSTAEDAARQARMLKQSVRTRSMPPWGADNTGLCNTWKDAHWLSDEEISIVVRWANGGAPAGDISRARHRPPPPVPALREVSVVLDTGAEYTATLGQGSYRCFIVDPKLERDRWLTALQMRATEPRAVRHVALFALESAEAEARAQALESAEPGPGYRCYGTPRVEGARWLASWNWNAPLLRLPEGTGLRLEAGRKLVVQVHYDVVPVGMSATTRTWVDLELQDKVRPARIFPMRADSGSLQPGLQYVELGHRMPLERPLEVLGVAPRMHVLGITLQLDVERGGERSCLANFDHWNFYNQRSFEYARPMALKPGDTLQLSCVYNTQSRLEPVSLGEDIEQEECVAYLYVTQ